MIVTIDGPAGTGKSTVARTLAEQLGYQFLDTGAMYRMLALRVLSLQVDPQAEQAVVELTQESQMDLADGECLLDGENVTALIRTSEVTRTASLVAQYPKVRELLVERQREIAARRNIVCEGRDQGTVAFPHAEFKFFLTAQPEERVRRRQQELAQQGQQIPFEELFAEQIARDQRDEARAVAPLRPAEDAFVIDTTSLSLEDVVSVLRERIQQAMSRQ